MFVALDFLLFAGSPFAEANTCRLAPGDGLKLTHDILHGVSNSWNIETKQTNPIIRNLNIFVPSLGSLHIKLPLLHSDFAGDVINDSSLLGFSGGLGHETVEKSGDARSDSYATSSDQSSLHGRIERGDNHIKWGGFLFGAGSVILRFWIGTIVSRWWIDAIWGGPIFLTNVKAHPPLGARASAERGVEVGVIMTTDKRGGS